MTHCHIKSNAAEPSLKFEVVINFGIRSYRREFIWPVQNHQCRLLVDLYNLAVRLSKLLMPAGFFHPLFSRIFIARDEGK